MARICLHGFVSGRVQGVGYRRYAEQEAERLALDGWVRNLEDGRVEVLVEGEADAVQALVAWLETGPKKARVEGVELNEQPLQGIAGFIVR